VNTDHDHTYDCIVCGAHIDSQDELVRHNEEQHLRNAQGMERPRQGASQEGSRDGENDERKDPLPNAEL
jgi:hypothetical protein